jgi:chromate reductase
MSKIAVIVGSLRRDSINRKLAEALAGLAKPKDRYALSRIDDLPLFNQDLEPSPPAAVTRLKGEIEAADGVLIVTPEYNRSIPGVLKNAIDWASRPAFQSVFAGKPVLVVSTSGGALGGVRAQGHLKLILAGMFARIHQSRELVIPNANARTVDGTFTDDAALDASVKELTAFVGGLAG